MVRRKTIKNANYDALVDEATPVCIHFLDHCSDNAWKDIDACDVEAESCRLYGIIYEHDENIIKVGCLVGDRDDVGMSMVVIKSTIYKIETLVSGEVYGE